MIFSQIMMSLSPLINQTRDSQWQSFAQMLEDPVESRSFLAFLLEEKNS